MYLLKAEMKCCRWVTRHTRGSVQQGQADATYRHGPHGPHLDTVTESLAECLALFCNKPASLPEMMKYTEQDH